MLVVAGNMGKRILDRLSDILIPSGLDPSGSEARSLWRFFPHLLVALFATFYMVHFFDSCHFLGDEGVTLMGGWRILDGAIPYRDFFEIIPPFSLLAVAASFKIFGTTVFASRILTLSYGLLTIFFADRILVRYSKQPLPRLALALFLIPFGVFNYANPSHHWLANLLAMLAILSCAIGMESGDPRLPLFAAGAAVALCCMTLQDMGVVLAVSIAALFFPAIECGERRLASFLSWMIGAAAVFSAFALYLLPRVSLTDILYQWLIFPSTRYSGIPGNKVGLLASWSIYFSSWTPKTFAETPVEATSRLILSLATYILPFAAVIACISAYRKRWGKTYLTALLVAGSAACATSLSHRWSFLNLAWAAPIPMILVLWMASKSLEATGSWRRKAAASILALLILSSMTCALSGWIRTTGAGAHRVATPAGGLTFSEGRQADSVREAVDAVERLVPKDGKLFTMRFIPLFNFLVQRRNPTPYNFFVYPGYNTDEQALQVIGILEGLPEAFVVSPLPIDVANAFGGYLRANYTAVWKNGQYALLRRNRIGASRTD